MAADQVATKRALGPMLPKKDQRIRGVGSVTAWFAPEIWHVSGFIVNSATSEVATDVRFQECLAVSVTSLAVGTVWVPSHAKLARRTFAITAVPGHTVTSATDRSADPAPVLRQRYT